MGKKDANPRMNRFMIVVTMAVLNGVKKNTVTMNKKDKTSR